MAMTRHPSPITIIEVKYKNALVKTRPYIFVVKSSQEDTSRLIRSC